MARERESAADEKPVAKPVSQPAVDPKLVVQGNKGKKVVNPKLIVNLTAAEPIDMSADRLVEDCRITPARRGSPTSGPGV